MARGQDEEIRCAEQAQNVGPRAHESEAVTQAQAGVLGLELRLERSPAGNDEAHGQFALGDDPGRPEEDVVALFRTKIRHRQDHQLVFGQTELLAHTAARCLAFGPGLLHLVHLDPMDHDGGVAAKSRRQRFLGCMRTR